MIFLCSALQDTGRFHEDIFGVTLRTHEVTDRARKQVSPGHDTEVQQTRPILF